MCWQAPRIKGMYMKNTSSSFNQRWPFKELRSSKEGGVTQVKFNSTKNESWTKFSNNSFLISDRAKFWPINANAEFLEITRYQNDQVSLRSFKGGLYWTFNVWEYILSSDLKSVSETHVPWDFQIAQGRDFCLATGASSDPSLKRRRLHWQIHP